MGVVNSNRNGSQNPSTNSTNTTMVKNSDHAKKKPINPWGANQIKLQIPLHW